MADFSERKSYRYKGYDYSKAGAYFITICTQDKEYKFGNVVDGTMYTNEIGKIVTQEIHRIPSYYEDVEIANSVVMPNHIHMIIVIYDDIYSQKEHPKIGAIVGRYKAIVTKILGDSPWQDRFHDRIIRSKREFDYKVGYIEDNPKKWSENITFGIDPEI